VAAGRGALLKMPSRSTTSCIFSNELVEGFKYLIRFWWSLQVINWCCHGFRTDHKQATHCRCLYYNQLWLAHSCLALGWIKSGPHTIDFVWL
jgi:hypothetical protein